ncbi:MAG: hypothetical protein AAF251_03670 [Pseudomonadota bacterium]
MLKKSLSLGLVAALLVPSNLANAAQEGTSGTRSSTVPTYHLMQLEVKTAKVSLQAFEAKTSSISSCNEAKTLAKEIDAKTRRNRFKRASQLPESLRDTLAEMPAGTATPAFTPDGSTARVIVLCGRA